MVTRPFLALLMVAPLCAVQTDVAAQIASTESDLRGKWIVTVQGEPETRTLIITEVAPTDSGALLAAKYGITNRGQGTIEARITRVSERRQLNFITQAGTVAAAIEQADGSFSGTFTRKNGVASSFMATRATVSQSDAPLSQDWALRPTISVGNRWEYSYRDTRFAVGCAYTLTIGSVTATRIVARIDKPEGCDAGITGTMAVAPGSSQTFDSNFNHFYHSKSAIRVFDFPLHVGKQWTQQYEYGTSTWRYTADLSATVDAVEEVTVPAGTFKSFRITVRREYRGEATGRQTQAGNTVDTFWYSPVVKNFVKRTYRDYGTGVSSSPIERELISYSVAQ